MNRLLTYGLLLLVIFITGCEEEGTDLPSVEQRSSEAINNLKDQLTAPANGWKLNYHPNQGSGTYYMILKFNENGSVNIQSDLAADNGAYFNQVITYRIDAALGLELIFENYVAFHYLFELQQANFGGEFEFIFLEESGGNLFFESKSDLTNPTVIALEPASPSDEDVFSREIASNFETFAGQSPRLFGGIPPTQHLYFSGPDISLFWAIDLTSRLVLVDVAGQGSTIEEVLNNGSLTNINHQTSYSFKNGKFVLDEPFSASVQGTNFTISEVSLGDLTMTGQTLCDTIPESTPVYSGSEATLGAFTMTKSLFNSSGVTFVEQEELYSVNVLFVIDGEFNSLSETGSIANGFPNALGFAMAYGYNSPNDSIPEYAVGLLAEDENENLVYYFREFEPTSTVGNKVEIKLLDKYFYSTTPDPIQEQSLTEITEEIFFGSTIYAYDIGIEDLTAFQLYNPCNNYEFVLVQ